MRKLERCGFAELREQVGQIDLGDDLGDDAGSFLPLIWSYRCQRALMTSDAR